MADTTTAPDTPVRRKTRAMQRGRQLEPAALADIETLLAPVIQSLGLELWGIDYRAGTGNGLLRVYIDVAERAVTLEDCERASREISALMDVHDQSLLFLIHF